MFLFSCVFAQRQEQTNEYRLRIHIHKKFNYKTVFQMKNTTLFLLFLAAMTALLISNLFK